MPQPNHSMPKWRLSEDSSEVSQTSLSSCSASQNYAPKYEFTLGVFFNISTGFCSWPESCLSVAYWQNKKIAENQMIISYLGCPEQDSNLHASRHAHLKRARLPFRHLGLVRSKPPYFQGESKGFRSLLKRFFAFSDAKVRRFFLMCKCFGKFWSERH